MKIVSKYPKVNNHIKLTLIVDSFLVANFYKDVLYNTHDDCRGHTGCIVSICKGGFLRLSLKQKLNVKSSTERGLVGAHDGLSVVLLIRYLIKDQGYSVEHNKLY